MGWLEEDTARNAVMCRQSGDIETAEILDENLAICTTPSCLTGWKPNAPEPMRRLAIDGAAELPNLLPPSPAVAEHGGGAEVEYSGAKRDRCHGAASAW